MAILGVIAGVRGNLEALAAVLAALGRRPVSQLLCAGDVVGYNADPAECAALLRERRAVAVAGRNDLIAVRRLGFEGCSSAEMHALKTTRRSLAAETAAWLRSLPTHQVVDGTIALVHAGVRDVAQPVPEAGDIRENAGHLRYDFPGAKACFFGRGDEPCAWEVDGNVVRELRIAKAAAGAAQVLRLDRRRLQFIHPGCVDALGKRAGGHSRNVAQYALFDTLEWTVEFAAVAYQASSTEAKAAVFGYRTTALTAGLHAVERALQRALRRHIPAISRGRTLPGTAGCAPAPPAAPGRRGSASTP